MTLPQWNKAEPAQILTLIRAKIPAERIKVDILTKFYSIASPHISVEQLDLCQQVVQSVLPLQDTGVTVMVQVGIVLQQLLGQDVVGHH